MTNTDLAPAGAPPLGRSASLFLISMERRRTVEGARTGKAGRSRSAQPASADVSARLMIDGIAMASRKLVDRGVTGVIIGDRVGPALTNRIRRAGLTLALRTQFSEATVDSGEPMSARDWSARVEAFDPDLVSVVVDDNPDFDIRARRVAHEKLAEASARLRAMGRLMLIELRVPPSPEHGVTFGDDFATELRPHLIQRVITELQWAGVEPDLWAIEGPHDPDTASEVIRVARRGDRQAVRCLVLGSSATDPELARWLPIAATASGFAGFTLSADVADVPISEHHAGRLDAGRTIDQIAAEILRCGGSHTSAVPSVRPLHGTES